MDLEQSAAIGLQRALVEREQARGQLAEERTKVMMLRKALEAAFYGVGYGWPPDIYQQAQEALDWTAEDE